jgi:hypothetical protein
MILDMKLNGLKDSLHFGKPFVSIAKRDYVQHVFNNREFPSKPFTTPKEQENWRE